MVNYRIDNRQGTALCFLQARSKLLSPQLIFRNIKVPGQASGFPSKFFTVWRVFIREM